MKKLLINGACFLGAMLTVALLILFFLPNYNLDGTLIYANRDKQYRLQTLPSPRIILIGGSNVSFGFDSRRLEETFGMPVVNMALHGNMGLRFMLEEVRPHIRPGDRILLVPDYTQFTGNTLWGDIELVALTFDGNPRARRYLSGRQWLMLHRQFVEYAIAKIKFPTAYVLDKLTGQAVKRGDYGRNSFDERGDVVTHRNRHCIGFEPVGASTGTINSESLDLIARFKEETEQKGAFFYLLPPSLDSISFRNIGREIAGITDSLKSRRIVRHYEPEAFVYPDTACYDFPFHLNGFAVRENTERVIKQLKNYEEEEQE